MTCDHPTIDQRQDERLWNERNTSESQALFNMVNNKQILDDLVIAFFLPHRNNSMSSGKSRMVQPCLHGAPSLNRQQARH